MSIEEIQSEAEEIFDEYDAQFAGKPRATRKVAELDELIERLEELLERARGQLNGGHNEQLVTLIERAGDNLEVYQKERQAIEQLQSQGEAPVQASHLATWANAEFHRYQRHFVGENRATRDVELLNEMIRNLEEIQSQMEALQEQADIDGLAEDIETVVQNREHYREEREQIVRARKDGTADERASYLAVAANEQFSIYGDLFAGKNRATRRTGLLKRVIRSLENIERQMTELHEEAPSEENQRNIGIVQDNLEMYREELDEIEEVHESIEAETLAGQLGGAANEVFQDYRSNFAGKDRSTRDLGQLGRMCDELYHLGRLMKQVDEDHDVEANRENLNIVLENMSLYQQEYNEIAEAAGSTTVDPR
jgi:transaldolase